jgi:hypothetical protein
MFFLKYMGIKPMDAVSIIVAALVAGAAKTAGEAVQDSYKGLKTLILQKIQSKPAAKVILEEHEKDSETYEVPLKKNLSELGVDKDEEIIVLAQKIMKLTDPEGSEGGKFNVNIKGDVKKSFIGKNYGPINIS